jgi:hypothetical protein
MKMSALKLSVFQPAVRALIYVSPRNDIVQGHFPCILLYEIWRNFIKIYYWNP